MIDTERLHLRPPRLDDLEALYGLTDDERARRFFSDDWVTLSATFDRLLKQAGGWALFGYSVFATIERETARLVGSCGLFQVARDLGRDFDGFPEAGWIIAPDRWGRGYAGEAMDAAIAWFESTHGQQRTVCMIARGNEPSERLAARLGYRAFRTAEQKGDPVMLYERG